MSRLSCLLLLMLVMGCSSFRAPSTGQIPFMSEQEVEKTFGELVSLPVNKTDPLNKFTFSSCATPLKPQPIWNIALGENPNLHINLGDNVYASRPEERPLRKMYALQAKVPEYANFRSRIPMLATWDDHDFGLNDGGAENPEITVAREQFLQFFPEDAKLIPLNQNQGVYHSVIIGPVGKRVQFLILDTRSFRSPLEKNQHPKNPLDIYQPTKDITKTLLGKTQWQWLESQLKKPAELRILVSSIQLLPEEHGFEKWMNFPHERGKLFSLLIKNHINNLVVLSGDRHQGEISQYKTGVSAKFSAKPTKYKKLIPSLTVTEVTASGINKTSNLKDEPNRYRIGEKYNQENFGLAEIDWAAKKITLKVVDIKAQPESKIEVLF